MWGKSKFKEDEAGCLQGEPYEAERDSKKTGDSRHVAEKTVLVG